MLAKLVALAIAPLGTAMALGLLGCLLSGRKNFHLVRWGRRMVLLAGVWLVVWSLPVASDALRGSMEARAGERVLSRLPQASAAVVLGGGMSGPRLPQRPDADLGRAADRVWHAARLYHAGKVPLLVLSGGVVRTGDGSEAEAMRSLLLALGVPDSAIVLEENSTNTQGNVAHTVAVLRSRGLQQPLLATSALHMPRARAEFERAGATVTPAPTDFEVIDQPQDLLQWLPSSDALEGSGRAFKELLGQLVGRIGR